MKYLAKFLAAGKTEKSSSNQTIKTIKTTPKAPFDGFDGSLTERFSENWEKLSNPYFTEIAKESNHQNHQNPITSQFITLTDDLAAIFAGNCRQCGDYLQSDGSCNLCKQPYPF